MPLVVEWQGYEGATKQQPFSTEERAENFKKFLETKSYVAEIKTVAAVKKW